MGGQCLLVLIGLNVLVMMKLLQNIVISGAQGLLMLMGSKFLIKMTRPQNIKIKNSVLHLFILGVFLIRFHFFFDPSGLGLDSSMTSYSKSPFKAIA